MRFLRACVLTSTVLCLGVQAGCREEDAITKRTIPYEDRERIRLRVAIVGQPDFVWFIRLDGPVEQVGKQQADFDAFVRSTEFGAKKDEPVKWKEPAGWKKQKDAPGMGGFALYRIDAKPKELEVKITRLPANGYKLMDNMHRWQKQVDVPLSESADDNQKYLQNETVGKLEITWVDMSGVGVHTLSKPIDPSLLAQKDTFGLNMDDKMKQAFTYTAPAAWAKADPGKFALEAFEVGAGEKTAKITVTPLKGPLAADVDQNVNRWRGNVGLEPLKHAEIDKLARKLEVGGVKSLAFDFENTARTAPPNNRILAVMVPISRGAAWFIVMTGPSDVVKDHKNAFEAFIQTFKK